MSDLTCARCQFPKPPSEFHVDLRRPSGRTAQCRECRGALANYRRWTVACLECRRHRGLDPNGCCSKCNVARGLRYCRRCKAMLPALLSFYRERAICKDCLRKPPSEG